MSFLLRNIGIVRWLFDFSFACGGIIDLVNDPDCTRSKDTHQYMIRKVCQ